MKILFIISVVVGLAQSGYIHPEEASLAKTPKVKMSTCERDDTGKHNFILKGFMDFYNVFTSLTVTRIIIRSSGKTRRFLQRRV